MELPSATIIGDDFRTRSYLNSLQYEYLQSTLIVFLIRFHLSRYYIFIIYNVVYWNKFRICFYVVNIVLHYFVSECEMEKKKKRLVKWNGEAFFFFWEKIRTHDKHAIAFYEPRVCRNGIIYCLLKKSKSVVVCLYSYYNMLYTCTYSFRIYKHGFFYIENYFSNVFASTVNY